MSHNPRPIPDELWLPLKRRIELLQVVVIAAMITMSVASVALISVWWWPTWVAFRIGVPLGIVGTLVGHVGLTCGRRALADLRQLIIDYHGIDPGGPS